MILHFWTIKSLHCLFFPKHDALWVIRNKKSPTSRGRGQCELFSHFFWMTTRTINNNSSSSNNRIFDRFALSIIEWGQSATPWRTGWYYSLSSECLLSFTLSCGCTQYFYRLVYLYQGATSGGRKVKAICSSLNGHLGMSWSRIKASRVSCDFMSRMLFAIVVCLFCTWYKIYIHVFPDWLAVKEVFWLLLDKIDETGL